MLAEFLACNDGLFSSFNADDISYQVELEAEKMEETLLSLFAEGGPLGEVPVFDFKPSL